MTDFLTRALERAPDSVAADDGREAWSFRALDERARAAASDLRALGAGPGTVCVITGSPSLRLLATLHGAFRTGACVAPLHPGLTPPERARALRELRPAVVVGEDPRAIETDGSADSAARTDAPSAAAALWTSGTTGSPRAVLLSEAGLRASADAAASRLGLGPGDRWYASLSPAHVGGLALLTRAALLGSALVVRGGFSVQTLADLVERGEISHASLVPTMLARLVDHWGDRRAPDTLRCLLLGGARTPPELVRRANDRGWPIALSYGLTEGTSQVATATPDEAAEAPDATGRPLDGVTVRIAASGEILVRGPTVSPGTLDGARLADPDGWLATGDLGELDALGRLRVTGRRTDRIMTGGVTVDAHEVADVLRSHPGVQDAHVFGRPDATWGEAVVALVAVGPEGGPGSEALAAWLRPRLSGPKRPKAIGVVEHLPRNPNGKVDRERARAALEGLD